jgi:hypothetical protein
MSQDFNQRLGVLLASAADRQAWRRDGSPGSWNINQETGISDPAGYASGGGKVQAGRGSLTNFFGETGAPFVVGDRSYSPQALLNLPSDPTRLKALLLTGYRHAFGSVDSYLFGVTPGVLTLPVTPQVRSGLYQMLAGLPGVQSLGPVLDAVGQRGVAVALSSHNADCGH